MRPPLGAASPDGVMVSEIDPRLDRVAARRARWPSRPISASVSPAATRICACTRSTPKTSSVTVCSTCRRGLASMKANQALVAADPRRRAGTRRCRGCRTRRGGGEPHGCADDALAQASATATGSGAISISFWLRRWIVHSRSPKCGEAAVAVAEDLDLDMAGAGDQALGVERAVAEGALRLRPAAGEGLGDFAFAARPRACRARRRRRPPSA